MARRQWFSLAAAIRLPQLTTLRAHVPDIDSRLAHQRSQLGIREHEVRRQQPHRTDQNVFSQCGDLESLQDGSGLHPALLEGEVRSHQAADIQRLEEGCDAAFGQRLNSSKPIPHDG